MLSKLRHIYTVAKYQHVHRPLLIKTEILMCQYLLSNMDLVTQFITALTSVKHLSTSSITAYSLPESMFETHSDPNGYYP